MLTMLLSELLGKALQSGELLTDQPGRLAAALRIQTELRQQMAANPAAGSRAPEPKWVLAAPWAACSGCGQPCFSSAAPDAPQPKLKP
jgi:hypothetical protein